jgi:hypothetical protein
MRITEMMALQDSQKGYGQPSGNAGIMGMFLNQIKEKQDEQRRQKNIETQMTNAQRMMKQMAQYGDMSSNAKAGSITETDGRKKVVSATPMIPVKEMTMDENGQPSIKIGFRAANPTEQKNLLDIQQSKMEQAKAEELRQHALGYIQGTVPEAVMGEVIVKNGGKPEDLIALRGLKNSTRGQGTAIPNAQPTPIPSAQVPEGFRPTFKQDDFGNVIPGAPEAIPMTEVKAQRDMERENKADSIKSQNAIDRADSTIKTIDHLIANKNYFGPLEGAIAPVFAGKIEFNKNFKNLQANAVMDVLSEMKSQSRTGATGFGALNEKELALIMDAASKLDTRLDEATAAKYLNEMKVNLQKIIDRERNGYQDVRGGQQQGQTGKTQTYNGKQYPVLLDENGREYIDVN